MLTVVSMWGIYLKEQPPHMLAVSVGLYQECNVSITPLPGAVTTSPVNAGNTVDVQVFKT